MKLRAFSSNWKRQKIYITWLQLGIRVEAGDADFLAGQLLTWHRCVYIYPRVYNL